MTKDPKEIRQAKEEANDLAKLGKYEDAIKVLKKLALWEKREVAHNIKIAELYGKLKKTDQQIEWYQSAATRYAEQGHLPKAIAMAKIILGIDPKHEQTQALLAGFYAQKDPLASLKPAPKPAAAPAPAPAPAPVKAAAPPVTAPAPAEESAEVPVEEIDVDIGITPGAVLDSLPRIPIFSDLHPEEFRRLIDFLEVRSYEENQHVVTEGEPGNAFYVICGGSASVVKEDYAGLTVELATLSEGSFFGEFGYLSGMERSASVVAKEPLEVLEFSREAMDKLIAEHPRVRDVLQQFYRERVLNTLMSISPLFEPFDPAERRNIMQRFDYKEHPAKAELITQGAPAQGLFIVVSGEVEVVHDGADGPLHLADLHAGEFFGEMSLLTGQPTNANVRTTKKTATFRLAPEEFQGVAEAHPELINIISAFAAERRLHNQALRKAAVQRGEQGLV